MARNRLLPDRLRPTEAEPPGSNQGTICDDLLYGAEQIRAHMKLKTVTQVYQLRRGRKAPIFEMPGIGLAARKSSLDAWIRRLEEQVANSNTRG